MSALTDEQLDALVPSELFGWALGLGGMKDALREYARAVADAAVQAAREGLPPGAGVWQVYDDSGNYGVLPTLAMCQFEFPGKLYRWVPTPPAAPVPEGYVLVPVEPTEEQWGGLARDLMMWMDFERKTPRALFSHLEMLGREIPQWLRDEPEMQSLDHVPSKGTRAVLVYRAMLAACKQESQ